MEQRLLLRVGELAASTRATESAATSGGSRSWQSGIRDLFLYGSDFSNSSVNDVQAAEYRHVLREAACDELVPLVVNACEIRF